MNLRCYLLVRKNHECIFFVLYYQVEIFCRLRFKFLIENFTVALIKNFLLIENLNFQNNLFHKDICQ